MTEKLTPCIKTAESDVKDNVRYYRIYDGLSVVYLSSKDLDNIIKEYNKLKKCLK